MAGELLPAFDWRSDIDALVFEHGPAGGRCFVHRLAFRSLIGIQPEPGACMDWFCTHHAAFSAAAETKLAQSGATKGAFHLNSRDIRRALEQLSPARQLR
ncbi:hypothetical protein PDO_2350 [Rhizobium sp. PDO1-076]|uniref:hypothetical protein n=1 Tax=Rhizobium sp. PDO1-076 TaxID=1125979 RepID=UPI00024E2203|nr:hypothetical protein [Rhizobium sp. PDO1-076]EHS50620.1 hypothetical protein PDO_2350 [Rhizobium sp. PDO1-076]